MRLNTPAAVYSATISQSEQKGAKQNRPLWLLFVIFEAELVKPIMKRVLLLAAFAVSFLCQISAQSQVYEIKSPDKKISITILVTYTAPATRITTLAKMQIPNMFIFLEVKG